MFIKKCKLAYNVKLILLLSILFGLYDDLVVGKFRHLCKLYCVAFYLCFNIYLIKYTEYFNTFLYLEYSVYFYCSLLVKRTRLSYFLFSLPSIDSLPYAKKNYKKINKIYFTAIIFLAFISVCVPVLDVFAFGVHQRHGVVVQYLFEICVFAVRIERLKFLLVTSLLFYRLRVIRMTIEKRGFGNSPLNRFGPMTYIQMYSTVLDWYEKINVSLKFLVLVWLISFFEGIMWNVITFIIEMKTNGFQRRHTFLIFIMTSQFIGTVLLPFAMLDKASDEIDEIMTSVVTKRNECTNERKLSELEKLVLLVRHRPLPRALWRFIKMDVRSLFKFISFCMTSTIAVLQIKDNRGPR